MGALCEGCQHLECMPGLRLVGWCARRLSSVSRRKPSCELYVSKRHRDAPARCGADEHECVGVRCPTCGSWEAELFARWSEDTELWVCTVECATCHRALTASANKLSTVRLRAMSGWQMR